MRIVNTLKFSLNDVNPIGIAFGAMYVSAGIALAKVGTRSLMYGLGLRGKVMVYK